MDFPFGNTDFGDIWIMASDQSVQSETSAPSLASLIMSLPAPAETVDSENFAPPVDVEPPPPGSENVLAMSTLESSMMENTMSLFTLGEHENALELITKVVEMNPRSFPGFYYQALLLRHLGRDGEATEAFQKITNLLPQSEEDLDYRERAFFELERAK